MASQSKNLVKHPTITTPDAVYVWLFFIKRNVVVVVRLHAVVFGALAP